jgi:anti-anti-sigma regulatory factor
VELNARLDIAQAADLHRALLSHLAAGGPVVVDGTQVEEIDTAMLQLLASLWRSSAARGIACTWKGASGALRQTATLLGVAEVLNFPAGEPV